MKNILKNLKRLWQDESGQGTTEYFLMIVVVSAIVLIFKGEIASIITSKTQAVGKTLEDAMATLK